VSAGRLLVALRWDARLQLRHGFYAAAAFVAGLVVLGLSRLPERAAALDWLVPPLVAANLTMGTFYFVSGLVLLEKGEGSLAALVVTPLRPAEYLASKVLTLSALAVVENVAIVAVFAGVRLGLGALLLALGVALAGALLVLAGFLAVVRYDSINEFLAPSVLYAGLASLPVFLWLLGWDHWLLYLHPLQGALLVMRAAFGAVPAWQLAYGVLYPAVWIGLAGLWSGRAFRRFVVAPAGASAGGR
jgi:fluoroquinolone transport system permease protein